MTQSWGLGHRRTFQNRCAQSPRFGDKGSDLVMATPPCSSIHQLWNPGLVSVPCCASDSRSVNGDNHSPHFAGLRGWGSLQDNIHANQVPCLGMESSRGLLAIIFRLLRNFSTRRETCFPPHPQPKNPDCSLGTGHPEPHPHQTPSRPHSGRILSKALSWIDNVCLPLCSSSGP